MLYEEVSMFDSIAGYEDIHKDEPYIDADEPTTGEVAHVYMLYVPPHKRGRGIGGELFRKWVIGLPSNIKRVRLKAVTLGGSDALSFWKRLGFTEAFCGVIHDEIDGALVLGVNGYENPVVEYVQATGDEYRHWIEGDDDVRHFHKNPQRKAG